MVANDQVKTEIYQEYSKKVFRFLNGKVNNRYLAEDLCSEVFLKVFNNLDSFDETKASVSTWIYTITRNTLTDYFRKNAQHSQDVDDSVLEFMPEKKDQALETLADALETLEPRERDILLLHYYSGLTLGEIAERMKISYSYVKLLHNKALELTRQFFDAD